MTDLAEIRNQLAKIEADLKRSLSPWLSVPEAAVYSSLSESTIRRFIDGGKLNIHRVGGRILIHKKDLDAWILFNRQTLSGKQKQILKDYEV